MYPAATAERLVWRPGDSVASLKEILASGGVLAIPTESSYGLGVHPRDARGVEAVRRIKGRPAEKPLPVVAASLNQLAPLGVQVPAEGLGGLEDLWPCALSVLLPLSAQAGSAVPAAAGSGSLAVRIPGHAGLRELLDGLGHPLTATSANPSGEPPITDPERLAGWLAGSGAGVESMAAIVDGGVLEGGKPSTLVSLEAGVISVWREGRVALEELRRAAPDLTVRRAFSAGSVEISVEDER